MDLWKYLDEGEANSKIGAVSGTDSADMGELLHSGTFSAPPLHAAFGQASSSISNPAGMLHLLKL